MTLHVVDVTFYRHFQLLGVLRNGKLTGVKVLVGERGASWSVGRLPLFLFWRNKKTENLTLF